LMIPKLLFATIDAMTPSHPTDPIAAVTHPDPYPYYARLVAESPLYRDDALGLWVATMSCAGSIRLCAGAAPGLPRNLTLGDSATPELRQPVHPILEELEPLERRQAQGPPD
jgi:hypothetical protein